MLSISKYFELITIYSLMKEIIDGLIPNRNTDHDHDQARNFVYVFEEMNLEDNESLLQYMQGYSLMCHALECDIDSTIDLPDFDFEAVKRLVINALPEKESN